jgi:hypothetical protein
MEKRKQRDERKETGRRQEEGYERKEQVAISRLRTGYTRATHGPKMEGVSNPLCPSCNIYLSVDNILWECKETEDQRMNTDMRKEQWINGNKWMEKMFDYAKKTDCLCTTEYRNGKNNRKVSKIIARRKKINQDGDENEERRL